MTFMPGFEQAQDFPGPSDHLPRVPFGAFAGQAFASLAPAAPFDAFFGDIAARLAWLPFDAASATIRRATAISSSPGTGPCTSRTTSKACTSPSSIRP